MKIYIDHFPDQDDFAKTIYNRIRQKDDNAEIIAFVNLRDALPNSNSDEELEKLASNLIDESDIIIPLISSTYLAGISTQLTERFSDLTDKKEKFIFPIICDHSNWSSINWIVRSKVFPDGGIPLNDLTRVEKEKSINDLLQTLQNILFSKVAIPPQLEIKSIVVAEKIVFISHDHDDADFAELLKLQFEKHQISGWIDSERLKIGQDWREEIDEGISNSIAVIAIMSPEAKKSEYVTYEWAFAWGKGKKIFPIMLKQTSLHPRLESLQYLDFTNRATRPWDKLIASIKALIE